mgnify:CR=1 FL=1
MKRISIISALLSCLAILSLTGCSNEELDTNQFSDSEVRLSAFAPNPVARGGVLRILGSNLQKVQQVEIPGVEPISQIEVKSEGKISEIWVTVPVEGPQVGKISIVAGDRKLTSKTELEYSEPIVFDGFEPATAMPGDVITVKGDYMSNIREVIFEGGAKVVKFESQSRHELKVKVPSNAVTGKFILGDVDEDNNPEGKVANLFYSAKELTIGDPTVKAEARGVVKANSSVTVKGSYLDMIASASFGDVDADITLAEDGKSITLVVPETAVDGEIVLVSFAGKEFKAGAYETLVPSALKVAPLKTRYKAGLDVRVTGKDLDLVTGADLAGTALSCAFKDNEITFTIPAEATDGKITLSLANGKTVETDEVTLVKPVINSLSPLELFAGDENIMVAGKDLDLVVSATLGGKDIEVKDVTETGLELVTTLTSVSGKVVLKLANGVSVESADEVKVNYHSKVIVTEMPAGQHINEEVVLKGTNFDLVENIFIGDTKVTQYSLRTPEEVRFLMPWCMAGSYNMSFHLFSGDIETVATPIEVRLQRVINTIWSGESYVTWSGGAVTALSWGGYDWSTVAAGTTLSVTFEVVDDNAVIRLGNGGWSALPSTLKFSNSDGEGNLAIAKGLTNVSLTLAAEDISQLTSNGGLVICGTGFKATNVQLITEISQEKVIWEGEAVADDWGNQPYVGTDGGAEFSANGVKAGQKLHFYVTPLAADWKLQVVEGHWGATYISVCAVGSDTESGKFTETALEGGFFTLAVTQEMLDAAAEPKNWGGIFVLNGDNVKLTKITVL